MPAAVSEKDEIIKIAVLAVGGQGGGVVTDWIVHVAEDNGWYAQATSVPGVAQRTGATIYYVEMVRECEGTPVLALMPSPGDVDIVLAAELMEAGRAMQRGFVSPDRTTLIASTDRTLAVMEKIVPGSGIGDPAPVIEAARAASKRFLGTDLDRVAVANGSVISASLFGALAGSEVLPFPKESFEKTVSADGGKRGEASLKAFRAGYDAVREKGADGAKDFGKEQAPVAKAASGDTIAGPEQDLKTWSGFMESLDLDFPRDARDMMRAGLEKVVDYQDIDYGREYLDRMKGIYGFDAANGGAPKSFRFTVEAAKYLANAMTYDDVIRVADLKTRATRFERVETEMGVRDAQVMQVTEFMHPRIEEIAGTLPAGLGRFILNRSRLRSTLDYFVNRGRRVRTDTMRGFLTLYFLGGLRRMRRRSLRHGTEMAHIEEWLGRAKETVATNYDLGVEVLRCRRLIKGYSDTHERGFSKFDRVLSALPDLTGRDDGADWLRRLIEAALKDEKGEMLDGALKTIKTL
ncbi:indolepyruvate oxidoreductase subunit beta family protein [Microbaculum sp. FT89]|uniref:indolepyruvate oxidoreductase subunit beta family protein n=1 Tax=Microbaculum sp. FT89 TaxID=3447298 RepID=UPI003F531A4D